MFEDVVHHKNFYCRCDEGIGFFAYCETDGLIYAISNDAIGSYMRENITLPQLASKLSQEYLLNKSTAGLTQLLPDASSWAGPPQEKLRRPLTINWLISKRCTHRCLYCYASDIIDNELIADDISVKEVAENILNLKPLNVVLSGGEPFLSSNLSEAIDCLAGKTGIIIDTNGFCFDQIRKLLPIIKKNKIHVRVSVDSLRTKCQLKVRPLRVGLSAEEAFSSVINTICLLLKHKVNFTIHTVLTKENANDLIGMGDKLWKLGIQNWRIFELQIYNSAVKDKLAFSDVDDKISRKNKYFINRVMQRAKNYWTNLRLNYTAANGDNNNVVLVLPDGSFCTEGKHGAGKRIIDPNLPKSPNIESFRGFSWGQHFERYIG